MAARTSHTFAITLRSPAFPPRRGFSFPAGRAVMPYARHRSQRLQVARRAPIPAPRRHARAGLWRTLAVRRDAGVVPRQSRGRGLGAAWFHEQIGRAQRRGIACWIASSGCSQRSRQRASCALGGHRLAEAAAGANRSDDNSHTRMDASPFETPRPSPASSWRARLLPFERTTRC